MRRVPKRSNSLPVPFNLKTRRTVTFEVHLSLADRPQRGDLYSAPPASSPPSQFPLHTDGADDPFRFPDLPRRSQGGTMPRLPGTIFLSQRPPALTRNYDVSLGAPQRSGRLPSVFGPFVPKTLYVDQRRAHPGCNPTPPLLSRPEQSRALLELLTKVRDRVQDCV